MFWRQSRVLGFAARQKPALATQAAAKSSFDVISWLNHINMRFEYDENRIVRGLKIHSGVVYLT
jgi:hypothetical protein